jgi:hypothetical protein
MSNIKSKHALLVIAVVSLKMVSLAVCAEVNEPNYTKLLKQGLERCYKNRNPYGGIGRPISGLDHPNAIPFLESVLSEQLDWLPKHQQHLAKCYAAICLGATKNSRALEPLLEALKNYDPNETIEFVARYTAEALGNLGDSNAIDPLLISLLDERIDVKISSIAALGKFRDFRTIPLMFDTVMKEKQRDIPKTKKSSMYRELDKALSNITKVKFQKKYPSRNCEPWFNWWNNGSDFTNQRFEAKHNEWKAMKKETDLEKSNAKRKLSEMTDLGIPAIPFMVEKVKQGETALIPLISKLTDKNISETATRQECLDWWEANKKKWLIPFPETNARPAGPQTR